MRGWSGGCHGPHDGGYGGEWDLSKPLAAAHDGFGDFLLDNIVHEEPMRVDFFEDNGSFSRTK